jgi:hypothetical protein
MRMSNRQIAVGVSRKSIAEPSNPLSSLALKCCPPTLNIIESQQLHDITRTVEPRDFRGIVSKREQTHVTGSTTNFFLSCRPGIKSA